VRFVPREKGNKDKKKDQVGPIYTYVPEKYRVYCMVYVE
jgi:hypothetical protein